MAKVENVNFALIKKWEGGWSKDPLDPAAAFPVPDGSGVHTNIGITWKTFAANAEKLGYAATPKNFKNMPPDIWLKHFTTFGLGWFNRMDDFRNYAVGIIPQAL